MALDYSQFKLNQEAGEQAQAATTMGKRPRLDFSQFKKQQEEPVASEVIEQVQKAPQPEAPEAQPQSNQTVSDLEQLVDTSRFMMGAGAGGTGSLGSVESETIAEEAVRTGQAEQEIADRRNEGVSEYLRDEGLPTIGALAAGTAATFATGGMAAIPMVATFVAASTTGAMIGEGVEQVAKEMDIISRGVNEEPITSGYDFASRVAWRGAEEAAWALAPELLVRGGSAAVKAYLKHNPVKDKATKDLMTVMEKEAFFQNANRAPGDAEVEVPVLLSDVVDSGVANLMEAIGGQSFLAGGKFKAAMATQKELVSSAIEGTIEAKKIAVSHLVDATGELPSMGVASAINMAFRKADKLQRAAGGAIYEAIEKRLKSFGSDIVVDTSAVKKLADDELSQSIFGTRGNLPEVDMLLSTQDKSTIHEVWKSIQDLRSQERTLMKGLADNSDNRLRVVRNAAKVLEDSLDAALEGKRAINPNGDWEDINAMRQQADAIWKMSHDEFGNSYIEEVIKKTDALNGASNQLSKIFLRNEEAATNIMNILNKTEGMDAEALEQLANAKSALQAKVMGDIFTPFDVTRGKATAPSYKQLEDNKSMLLQLFGQEDYDHMVQLANAFSVVSGEVRKNSLAFAQGARESGLLLKAGESVLAAGPHIAAGGAFATAGVIPAAGAVAGIMAMAALAGRGALKGKELQRIAALVSSDISMYGKRQIYRQIIQQTANYNMTNGVSMTPEQRARIQEEQEADQAYLDTLE